MPQKEMLMARLASLLILIPILAWASAEEGQDASFFFPAPDGWLTETIPFPLGFAPSLAYEGLEELRFAPGMFKADQEDFWTYAFVWWVTPCPDLTPEILARDLEVYFEGLTGAVVGDQEIDLSGAEFSCHLALPDSEPESGIWLEGTAVTFDSFVTLENITLNVRVHLQPCPEQGRSAVIFQLSPQPYSHSVWKTLENIQEGFLCP